MSRAEVMADLTIGTLLFVALIWAIVLIYRDFHKPERDEHEGGIW